MYSRLTATSLGLS